MHRFKRTVYSDCGSNTKKQRADMKSNSRKKIVRENKTTTKDVTIG